MADHYQTLGVERDATQEDIKRAYRKMAHKHHPDKEGGDEEQFKVINEAYQVIGDEQKRKQYDQFGDSFEAAGGAGGNPYGGAQGFGGFNVNMDDLGGIGDIFEQFFGGASRGGTRPRRGRDIAVDATISLVESATGLKHELNLRTYAACSHCNGNGAEPGTPIKDCATCSGSGTINRTQQTPLGVFSQRAACPDCKGEGKKAETPCTTCKGDGRELRNRTLSIDIPAGIDDEQTIKVTGEGEVPEGGGMAGDLYVTIHVTSEKDLERDGDDIRTYVSVSFADAALGTDIKVKTLTGEQTVTIPSGTQPEEEIRLQGQGFSSLRSGSKGDQIVTVKVEIPTRLNRGQKEALEQFRGVKKKQKGIFG